MRKKPPMLFALAAMAASANAQQPFALDTGFRTVIQQEYVNSIVPFPDGRLLLSGQIRFPGDMFTRGSAVLLPDGSRDPSFTSFNGQGKLTPWSGKYYVSISQSVRRLTGGGYLDPSFILMNSGPYFTSLQGGDYHVYPDGRVLMSGAHQVNYPAGGWQGLHNLIWFSNTGYVDTTRTPRKGNGVLYFFKALPDGKFICGGTCSQFEGRAVDWIFRVHADGSPDTTFSTGVNWGLARSFLPLEDGRVYAAGNFRRAGFPNDTLRLVRFMPDGSLDPSFIAPSFTLGAIPGTNGLGAYLFNVQPWGADRIVVTGRFQLVGGEVRKGICVLDHSGALMDEFDGCGVNLFTYMGNTTASISGIVPDADSTHYYIWGTYTGYDDGETNDPLQRFVTRLHVGDFTTDATSATQAPSFALYPNPTSASATLQLEQVPPDAQLVLRDALGRQVRRMRVSEHYTPLTVERSGVYVVELWSTGQRMSTQRLVVEW